ncbi:class I SAM-dependent methyltransferase [Amycolatopsis alba]|uniref:class I SAM-dependent methyltransferase n=1 Tax=Amycolatopsis alba TaxID=76020 RepID=UPI0003713B66|nr:methyltransferase domain-containing protein [Amycolatopsis alba]
MNQPIAKIDSLHEQACFEFYEGKRNDLINLLPGDDGFVHSHFAVTDFDHRVLDAPDDRREEEILRELHRIENLQVEALLDFLGPVDADQHVMDSGCGRGGTSFIVYDRHHCFVRGVDFSPYRLEFAGKIASQRKVEDRVTFHQSNMTGTPFADDTFDVVINNESQEHLESMDALCRENSRVLKPGGRFAVATWVADSWKTQQSEEVTAIDSHYRTRIHTRATYLRAMVNHSLIPIRLDDLTEAAIPYWQLRSESSHRSGVEPYFLSALGKRIMNYLFVIAEYQPGA